VRSSLSPPRSDLLLKGGHVMDAKNDINSVQDVAIKDGNIAAVAPDRQTDEATIVVDAKSLYVDPGIVDIHVHVFCRLDPARIYRRAQYSARWLCVSNGRYHWCGCGQLGLAKF